MRQLYFFVLIALIFTACGVPKEFQHQGYLQDSVTETEKKIINKPILIEPGDRLNIAITAINKDAANQFNMATTSGGGTGAAAEQGYLVDSAGNIQMLQLGVIKVGGLTKEQVAANLQQQLESYVKGSVVTVSIANFKVSVFGEVARPGTLTAPDGKLTVLDAIIQSGDLTMYGRRQDILIVREMNGTREFGRININSNRVFESPYYNLKQNDMIYVEANDTKYINNDPRLERSLRNLGIATTLLTTAVLIINLIGK